MVEHWAERVFNFLSIVMTGAIGAFVRLVHTNPQRFTLLQIIGEIIVGGFVAWMAYLSLKSFSTFSFDVISIICGISGVMAREVIGLLITWFKHYSREKLNEFGYYKKEK